MITIDIQTDDEEGRWFPFFYSKFNSSTGEIEYGDPIEVENEEDGPRMRIRNPVSFFEDRNKNKKTRTKYVVNSKTRGMDAVTEDVPLSAEEKKKEEDDFRDFVISGIENFKLNGKLLTCDRATKIEIMKKPIVSLYVHRCIEMLQSSGVVEEKTEKKTSSSSLSSKTIKVDQA